MDTLITVLARNVYGSLLLYPSNDQARRLAGLIGTKTLTVAALGQARAMGFRIDVVGDAGPVSAAREALGE